MDKKKEMKLTEGSRYRILSIGGKETALETEGVFKGFSNLGIEEGGLLIELGDSHGKLQGKIRIVPLHAILAIDVLDIKEHEKDEVKETNHYYG